MNCRVLLLCAFLFTLLPVTGAEPKPEGPFKFVATKTEPGKLQPVMELYAFAGPLNPAELKKLCAERKSKSPAKTILYVVVFDSAANAKFPKTPFTAEYGSEENTSKHIRALYMFNKLNGFSEVRYHEKNISEHISIREKL